MNVQTDPQNVLQLSINSNILSVFRNMVNRYYILFTYKQLVIYYKQ